MKNTLILAACILSVTACSSKKPAEPAASDSAPPAAAAPAAQPAAQRAGEPAKVEITDALVLKYMDYQKQEAAIIEKYLAETGKNIASAKGDAMKTMQQISINEKLGKEFETALQAKRTELGLTEDQFNTLRDAVGMIANGRMLYNQMGGDAQLAKMQAEQKKQLAALPEAQRAEAEKTIADMSKGLTDMKNGLDLRKKYGDQAADVLLKHADELAKQQWENLKKLGEKK
jgi:hypothetical protein